MRSRRPTIRSTDEQRKLAEELAKRAVREAEVEAALKDRPSQVQAKVGAMNDEIERKNAEFRAKQAEKIARRRARQAEALRKEKREESKSFEFPLPDSWEEYLSPKERAEMAAAEEANRDAVSVRSTTRSTAATFSHNPYKFNVFAVQPSEPVLESMGPRH